MGDLTTQNAGDIFNEQNMFPDGNLNHGASYVVSVTHYDYDGTPHTEDAIITFTGNSRDIHGGSGTFSITTSDGKSIPYDSLLNPNDFSADPLDSIQAYTNGDGSPTSPLQYEEARTPATPEVPAGGAAEETPAGDTPAGGAAEETPAGDTPAGGAAEETPAGDTPAGGATEETPAEETPAEETPAEETPAEETPAEETPAEETPAEETPAEETPAEETPAEETPAEETPAEETPAEETPAEETPAEETPAEETPAEETPAEETPAEETPAEETPAEETPAEETPAEETPAEETPAEETPAEETPAEETPAEETPAEETPAEETPAEETPAEETPAEEKSSGPELIEGQDGETTDPDTGVTTKIETTQNSDGTTTQTITETDKDGVTTTTTTVYDKNKTPVKQTVVTPGTNGNTTVETTFDENGNPASVKTTNPDGSETLSDADGDVIYSRDGATNADIAIDIEKFIAAYKTICGLCEAAKELDGIRQIDISDLKVTEGSSPLDTTDIESYSQDCMKKAGGCALDKSGSNISGIQATMYKIIMALYEFDETTRHLWDDNKGEIPEEFGGELAEEGGDEPEESTTGHRQWDPPVEATEAPTESEEEKLKKLSELLSVDFDDLAVGAKYVVYGTDFEGIDIYYKEEDLKEATLNERLLSILNYFGRNADDKKLYGPDGKQISQITDDMKEVTFVYKKDGKEHKITLKINPDSKYKDEKYPSIRMIVEK